MKYVTIEVAHFSRPLIPAPPPESLTFLGRRISKSRKSFGKSSSSYLISTQSLNQPIQKQPIGKSKALWVAFLNAIFITMPMVFSCAIPGSIISRSPGKIKRAQPVPSPNRHYSPRFGRVSSLTVEAPETRLRQRLHAGLFPFPLTLTKPLLLFQKSRL